MSAEETFECYLSCWKVALRELLGWPEKETDSWAQRWKPSRAGDLTHERAMWYVSTLLIPKRLKQPGALHGETLPHLAGRIQSAIDYGPAIGDEELERAHGKLPAGEWLRLLMKTQEEQCAVGNWFWELHPENYDWHSARVRINTILGEYGESLPDVVEHL